MNFDEWLDLGITLHVIFDKEGKPLAVTFKDQVELWIEFFKKLGKEDVKSAKVMFLLAGDGAMMSNVAAQIQSIEGRRAAVGGRGLAMRPGMLGSGMIRPGMRQAPDDDDEDDEDDEDDDLDDSVDDSDDSEDDDD